MNTYLKAPEREFLRSLYRANPNLPPPLDITRIRLSSPVAEISGNNDTRVTATAGVDDPLVQGSMTLRYQRLDIGRLFSGMWLAQPETPFTTSRAAARALIERYHLPLADTDFVEEPVIRPDRIRFRAASDSLWLKGVITLGYEPIDLG